jgi:hypothetical protein
MVAVMVVVVDEPLELRFEIARLVVVFEQDSVLQRLMPPLDLAFALRMVSRRECRIVGHCAAALSAAIDHIQCFAGGVFERQLLVQLAIRPARGRSAATRPATRLSEVRTLDLSAVRIERHAAAFSRTSFRTFTIRSTSACGNTPLTPWSSKSVNGPS